MIFSTKNVSLVLGQSQTKVRRWVKEFLPPDPEKGLRSGKTRKHQLNEVFKVFLGGYLVTHMGFSVADARIILKDIIPLLTRKGLLPLSDAYDTSLRTVEKNVERYDIHIMLTGTPRAFFYECRGLIREQHDLGGGVKCEYISERFSGNHGPTLNPIVDHVRILPISVLLQRFDTKLSVSSRAFH